MEENTEFKEEVTSFYEDEKEAEFLEDYIGNSIEGYQDEDNEENQLEENEENVDWNEEGQSDHEEEIKNVVEKHNSFNSANSIEKFIELEDQNINKNKPNLCNLILENIQKNYHSSKSKSSSKNYSIKINNEEYVGENVEENVEGKNFNKIKIFQL